MKRFLTYAVVITWGGILAFGIGVILRDVADGIVGLVTK